MEKARKGRDEERRQEKMEFIKTIARQGLFTHSLVHVFVYRPFTCPLCGRRKGTMGSKPCLVSLVRRTNKQTGDHTTLI